MSTRAEFESDLIHNRSDGVDLPLVAIGIIVWNGVDSIGQTLESLISQTYRNLIIYVLDNQSTDGTVQTVEKYMLMDSRIRLSVDSIKRNIVDAQYEVFQIYLRPHALCMFACDDDVYDEGFITKLYKEMSRTDASLVYSKHGLIDGSLRVPVPDVAPLYGSTSTQFRNALTFLLYRNCVPIFFGLYRVDRLASSMLHFRLIDKHGFDHENLMIFHFLLCNNVSFVSENLFFYRKKERIKLYYKRGYKFSTSGLKKYFYRNLHNLSLTRELGRIIRNSETTILQSLVLYLVLPLTYIHRTYFGAILSILRSAYHKFRIQKES
jgi:glycosyltransferase involved in cell wall biosynthesis